jgi:hypothetical protein
VIRVRLFYCRSRKVHLGYQKRVGERKCEISSLSIPTKIRLLAGWTLAPTLQIRNERQRTSTNVSERQRTSATLFTVARWCSLSFVGVHWRSSVFTGVRRCSRSLAGVHCRSSVFTGVRRCSLSLGVVGVIPNVYLRFSWRQTTFTSRSLRHRMPPGVPNQSLFWYLGRALRSTSRRRPRRSSTTIQLPDTWPILWLCTCSLTERASVISKWLICSP